MSLSEWQKTHLVQEPRNAENQIRNAQAAGLPQVSTYRYHAILLKQRVQKRDSIAEAQRLNIQEHLMVNDDEVPNAAVTATQAWADEMRKNGYQLDVHQCLPAGWMA